MTVTTDPRVPAKFATYPAAARLRLAELRALIVATAEECGLHELEETLKWGEPSYLARGGSTLRIDFKHREPDRFALYLKCTSRLVPTIRELFGDRFTYENNRALWFGLDQPLPVPELKSAIRMALRYHSVKHLPLLGEDVAT